MPPQRIRRIQQTMRSYLADGLLHERDGAIYVERTIGDRIRRGLMLELDLEHYDFAQRIDEPDPPDRGHDRRAAGAAHRGAARRRT